MATSPRSAETILSTSISWPADSPARMFPRPESRPGCSIPMERRLAQAFGLSSPVSFGRFDPNTCLLRTYQASLFTTECDTSSENFPDSGMWGAGSVYELQTSELPTCESASSSWPTATPWLQEESVDSWERRKALNKLKGYNGNGMGTPLDMAATTWPTAQAT